MAAISFKSVGNKQENIKNSTLQVTPTPIGIKTPLQLSNRDGLLEMHYKLEDQLSDNLRNLLLTNWGERLGEYFFGANLKPLTSEFVSQDNFDNEAVVRIKSAVSMWMPYVELIDFLSEVNRTENSSTGIINVTITYNIQALNVFDRKLQIVLYVM